MNKKKINQIVDYCGIITSSLVIGTGIVLGLKKTFDISIFPSANFRDIKEAHELGMMLFMLTVIVHLGFHWTEVKALFKQYLAYPVKLLSDYSLMMAAIILVFVGLSMIPEGGPRREVQEMVQAVRKSDGIGLYIHYAGGLLLLSGLLYHVIHRRKLLCNKSS